MKATNIILPNSGWTPRESQLDAWNALRDPQYNTWVLAWHRRMGKDEIALHDTAIRIANRVGNYWHMLPEQEQARKVIWASVNPRTGKKRWEDAFPSDMIKHIDNQTMTLTFHNGSTWQVLGSDNYNSLVGTTPVHIVMSEAALADPAAYGYFRPILLENKGTSLHISSVRGKNHFYNLYKFGQGSDSCYVDHCSAIDSGLFTTEQLSTELSSYIALYGSAIGESMFRQEFLSDWNAATVGAIFTKELQKLQDEGRACPCVWDPRYPVSTAWDIGVADLTVIIFFQVVGNEVRIIDWYSANNTGLGHYAEVLSSKAYSYENHHAPHDIAVREWTAGLSRMEEAKKFGIYFSKTVKLRKSEQIAAASNLFPRVIFNVKEKQGKEKTEDTQFILEALGEYKFTYSQQHKVMSKEPNHNWASHYADAFLVAAVAIASSEGRGSKQKLQGRGLGKKMPSVSEIIRRISSNPIKGMWGGG